MKIAIMQPYFFPYIGYISLIKQADSFMLFDPVQFIRHGWIERNRILRPDNGLQYISVPLQRHSQTTKIKDIKINNSTDWKGRILAQLQHYKHKAPLYRRTIDVVRQGLDIETDNITDLNRHCLTAVCDYLGFRYQLTVFSELQLNIEPPHAPDEWALNICKALGNVTEYLNPPGGREFFDATKYDNSNIKLTFLKPILEPYPQRDPAANFESGLSIVDVMMFNTSENINRMLDNFELLSGIRR